jgi:putative transposase
LILDGASIHKSKALRAWLAGHPEVELVYLPKYAAHRDNPIEKLWWHLKGYVAAHRCCRSMTELVAIIQTYFDQLTPERVFQLVA